MARHLAFPACALIASSLSAVAGDRAETDTTFGMALAAIEQRLGKDPESAIAGPGATQQYESALVRAALSVFEQSRHLDVPHFSRSDSIDGSLGLYNPDNIYLSALLADDGRYRIHGRRGTHAMLTLQLLDAYPLVALGRNLAAIDLDQLGIRPGDAFEIFLGGERRTEARWFQLPKGTKAVLARQTFESWQDETASTLHIERLDWPARPVSAVDAALDATDYLRSTHHTWNETYLPALRQAPLNRLPPARRSDTGAGGLDGQRSIVARFRLQADQALIITVSRSDALYQGIQLGNPWFVTPNYIDHQVSLTRAQARVDEDGRLRFVVSAVDPGVANWLDTAGNSEGYLFMRWQGLRGSLREDEAPVLELVELAELARHLPIDTHWVTADERAVQLMARRRAPLRQLAVCPPSTKIIDPMAKPASTEACQATSGGSRPRRRPGRR